MGRYATSHYINEHCGKVPYTNKHVNATNMTNTIESVTQDGTHSISLSKAIMMLQAGTS